MRSRLQRGDRVLGVLIADECWNRERRIRNTAALLAAAVLLAACATSNTLDPAYFNIDTSRLAAPDVAVDIPGLGPCTDNPDRRLHLKSDHPLHILVHGCFGSSGNFRGLSQVLAFHGRQSACFTYDDRARLQQSAIELRGAVDQLTQLTNIPVVTVIGHSQGALIARRSLTVLPLAPPARQAKLHLVTVSGPFAGIASAQTCGKTWLYPLTVGVLPAICYTVTGAKWLDITSNSDFIHEPGILADPVLSYLKIDTNESGTCRRDEGGRCLESDDIFSLSEQRNELVEAGPRTQRVEVNAGHVEIVGDKSAAPVKLLAILQERGVIKQTPPQQMSAYSKLLVRVYQVPN